MQFLCFPVLSFCLLCCFTDPAYAQDPYMVYPKPMRYQKTNGQLLTEAANIYKNVKKYFTNDLNGKKISDKVDGLEFVPREENNYTKRGFSFFVS